MGRPSKRSPEKIEEVRASVSEKTFRSLRRSEPLFDISDTTVYRILKDDLNYRFYHVKSVQPLNDTHKKQRTEFCRWLLEQPNPERFVMNVIWMDEKYFCLNQKPHRKNDGTWSNECPHEIVESNNRNDQKVMLFVAIVDGKVPVVHAFVDENGRNSILNGAGYFDFLREKIWPTFRSSATRKGYWFMQDGAPVHCTTEAKQFLVEKFQGRVISRGTANAWPAHSPDINPLDFYFWAVAQKRVYEAKPSTIAELINVVKQFASEIRKEVLENVALDVLERARLCLQVNGGHFQQLKKRGSKR